MRRMRPDGIGGCQVPSDAGAGLGDRGVCIEIHLLVFHRAPEPLPTNTLSHQRPCSFMRMAILASRRCFVIGFAFHLRRTLHFSEASPLHRSAQTSEHCEGIPLKVGMRRKPCRHDAQRENPSARLVSRFPRRGSNRRRNGRHRTRPQVPAIKWRRSRADMSSDTIQQYRFAAR
jgi:hypothetical protein